MANAGRINWGVHCQFLIDSTTDDQDNAAHINGTFSPVDIQGDGSMPMTGNTSSAWNGEDINLWTNGKATCAPSYTASTTISTGVRKFFYVKHTGYRWDATISQGHPGYNNDFQRMDMTVKKSDPVHIKYGMTTIFTLLPGEGVVLPNLQCALNIESPGVDVTEAVAVILTIVD
tara:strand:- start:10298 stop:10819 length:522 start_codon:yes stop_codon:yes gene_type:complete